MDKRKLITKIVSGIIIGILVLGLIASTCNIFKIIN